MAKITSSNFQDYLDRHTGNSTRALIPAGGYPAMQAYYGVYESKSLAHKTLCAAYGDFEDFSTITDATACTDIPQAMTVAVEVDGVVKEYQYKKTVPAAGYTASDLVEKNAGKTYTAGEYAISIGTETSPKINVKFASSIDGNQGEFINKLFSGSSSSSSSSGGSSSSVTPAESNNWTATGVYKYPTTEAAQETAQTVGTATVTYNSNYQGSPAIVVSFVAGTGTVSSVKASTRGNVYPVVNGKESPYVQIYNFVEGYTTYAAKLSAEPDRVVVEIPKGDAFLWQVVSDYQSMISLRMALN